MVKYICIVLFMLMQIYVSIVYAAHSPGSSGGNKQQQKYLSYSLGGDPLSNLIMTQNTDYTLTVTNNSGKVLPNFLASTSIAYIDRTNSTCLTTGTLQAGASCVLTFDIPAEGTVHYGNGSIEFFSGEKKKTIGTLPVFVQPLTWVADNKGLEPDNVFSSAAADSKGIIYFATFDGKVFKSNSADNQWVAFNKGLPSSPFLYIRDLVPVNSSVYLLTEKYGIFVTDNNSDSWTPDSAGLGHDYVYCITANNHTLYAGTSHGKVYEKTTGTKAGVSQWHYVSSVPGNGWNNGVSALLVFNHILYAGTFGSGLYKSVDNGKHWIPTGLSINNKEGVAYITKIVSLKNTLFVGTDYKGVLKSTDKGKTWQQVNHGMDNNSQDMLTVLKLIAFGNSLYADVMLINGRKNSGMNTYHPALSIYQSSDQGENWKNIVNEKYLISKGMMLVMSKGLLYINPEKATARGYSSVGIYRQQVSKKRGL